MQSIMHPATYASLFLGYVCGGLCQEVGQLVPKAGFCPQQSPECQRFAVSDVRIPTTGPALPSLSKLS